MTSGRASLGSRPCSTRLCAWSRASRRDLGCPSAAVAGKAESEFLLEVREVSINSGVNLRRVLLEGVDVVPSRGRCHASVSTCVSAASTAFALLLLVVVSTGSGLSFRVGRKGLDGLRSADPGPSTSGTSSLRWVRASVRLLFLVEFSIGCGRNRFDAVEGFPILLQPEMKPRREAATRKADASNKASDSVLESSGRTTRYVCGVLITLRHPHVVTA